MTFKIPGSEMECDAFGKRGGEGGKKKRINKEVEPSERAAEFSSAAFSISTSLLRASTLPAVHAQRHS